MSDSTSKYEIRQLKVSDLTNCAIQSRVETSHKVSKEYAEAMDRGAVFPPSKVMIDKDGKKHVFDGIHTLYAAQLRKQEHIDCEIYEGTLKDAFWLACSMNQTHGLRRNNDDKEHITKTALKLKGAGMSNVQIAEHCGVSHTFVAKVRKEMEKTDQLATVASRTGKDGRTINTANIGKAKLPKLTDAEKVILSVMPPLSPDTKLSAAVLNKTGSFIELHPSVEHPGYFYLVIYDGLDTDHGGVTYTKRPLKFTWDLLEMVLDRDGYTDLAWTSDPASGKEWSPPDGVDAAEMPPVEAVSAIVEDPAPAPSDNFDWDAIDHEPEAKVEGPEAVIARVKKMEMGANALDYARVAITQLERIRRNDPTRAEAFRVVKAWIAKQEGGNG